MMRDYTGMRRLAHAAIVSIALTTLSGLLTGFRATVGGVRQDAAPPVQDAGGEAEPKPQRVVVRTGRFESHAGTVVREDDAILVIETHPKKEILSFVKSRILHLTRMVDPEPGQRGAVVLTDGSQVEGIVISDDYDKVILEVEGIRTRYERAAVDHVMLVPTVRERYEAFKAGIQPQQYDRRLELCAWLMRENEFELALTEIESLEQDHPNTDGLASLAREVRAQIALIRRDPVDSDTIEGDSLSGGDQRNAGPVDHADTLPNEILSARDANLIRVYEIDFRHPPRVEVSPDTIRSLIQNYSSHESIPANAEGRAALFRTDPLEIVRLMFEVRARDLYSEINVLSEPYSLNLFKQRVHNTWLIQNCATSRCHGGVRAGRLFLYNRNYRDDRVRMTNFLILERLKLDSDKPPLIDYTKPSDSLIIQYALPVTEARYPHPDVPGWSHVFTEANTRMLEDAIHWIRSMYSPRPEYPVEFEPPALIVEGGDETGAGAQREDR